MYIVYVHINIYLCMLAFQIELGLKTVLILERKRTRLLFNHFL